jgi:alanine-synthesizing transaminase
MSQMGDEPAPIRLRRIEMLPPYALGVPTEGPGSQGTIDLGFGNPDLASPKVAVDALSTAAADPSMHRYAPNGGSPATCAAVARLYRRRFRVALDPDADIVLTTGAKQAVQQLLEVTVEVGDTVLVPIPAYPSHRYAPRLAGASTIEVPLTDRAGEPDPIGFLDRLTTAWTRARPRPRVLLLSFPHNPTTASVDLQWWQAVVDFAREQRVLIIHDFAYADTAFDGYKPPSVLQVSGAREVAVEVYSMTKSFSMAGWRVAFAVGNPGVLAGLRQLKAYQDYGVFAPIQRAAVAAVDLATEYPAQLSAIYQRRRDTLCEGLRDAGWYVSAPRATIFLWAPVPATYRSMGSAAFSAHVMEFCGVATIPGDGFGPGGDGHVRFALVADEDRLSEASSRIRALGLAYPPIAGDGLRAFA